MVGDKLFDAVPNFAYIFLQIVRILVLVVEIRI